MNKKFNAYRMFSFGGGLVGLITFLVVGLLPALVYGGFAGVSLASVIFGNPLGTNLAGRIFAVGGMAVGALGTGALFTVVGAAIGAGIYSLAHKLPAPEMDEERIEKVE